MTDTYLSNSITNATSLEKVVTVINAAAEGHIEGMEGIEFTPEMLAGCYAYGAASDSGFEIDEDSIDSHLEILNEAGAQFDHSGAVDYALKLADAS